MATESLKALEKVVKRLRGPKGCPWDRAQTHKSLKQYLLEEAYEVLETIEGKDTEKFKEELGDLLLQIFLHAELAREKGKFNIHDVAREITQKLIRRHPHVFGKKKARTEEEAWKNWEKIKADEAITLKGKSKPHSHMDGIPKALPALARADKVQRKASRAGFDWDQVAGAWEKVHEEIGEIGDVLKKRRSGASRSWRRMLQEEIGDLLFAIVNVTRKLDFQAEELLQSASNKFVRRFRHMEHQFYKSGKEISNHPIQELEQAWKRAKKASPGSAHSTYQNVL